MNFPTPQARKPQFAATSTITRTHEPTGRAAKPTRYRMISPPAGAQMRQHQPPLPDNLSRRAGA